MRFILTFIQLTKTEKSCTQNNFAYWSSLSFTKIVRAGILRCCFSMERGAVSTSSTPNKAAYKKVSLWRRLVFGMATSPI